MQRQVWILSAVALALGSVAVRWPFLPVPMINDEGAYAFIAHFWSADYQLYRDIPFDRPQAIFLVYRLILLLGEGIESIRLAAAAYNAVTVLALFWFAGEVWGRSRGWIAALALAVFGAAPHVEGFTANAELFMLLPLVLAAWATWQGKWLLAGLLAGLATVLKPSGAAGLVLAGLWLLLWDRSWKSGARLLAGFALAPALSVAHGVWIDAAAYWASFVDRRLLLFSVFSSADGSKWERALDSAQTTLPVWAACGVAAVLVALRLRDRRTAFGGLWLLSSLAGMAMGGRWYWHYFQQALPPLAFLAAGAHEALQARRPSWPWVTAVALALGLFVVREGPFWTWDPKGVSLALYGRPPYLHHERLVELIQRYSRPEESIHVAFSQAELYYLARRRPATSQLFWNEVAYSEAIFQEVVQALREGRPAVVVVTHMPPPARMSRPDFARLLEQHYRPVTWEPFPVFVRRKVSAGEAERQRPR